MLKTPKRARFAHCISQDTAPPVQETAIEKNAGRLAYQWTMGRLSVARIAASLSEAKGRRYQTYLMTLKDQANQPLGNKNEKENPAISA